MATEAQAKQLVDMIIYLAKDANINTKPSYDDCIKLVMGMITPQSAVVNPKVYAMFITQSGNAHPSPIIRKNDIGAITWSRVSTGVYQGTKTGAFPENATIPSNIPVTFKNKLDNSEVTVQRISSSIIEITTKDSDGKLADSLLTNFFIEINVFV